AAQTLSTNPNATREQTRLNDSSDPGRPQSALIGTELATSTIIKRPNTFTSKLPGDSAGPNKKGAPGFSDLDQLLAQKGPLGSGTKIRMPEDQLFSFDSAELQPGDILRKLVDLLKRNPKATLRSNANARTGASRSRSIPTRSSFFGYQFFIQRS